MGYLNNYKTRPVADISGRRVVFSAAILFIIFLAAFLFGIRSATRKDLAFQAYSRVKNGVSPVSQIDIYTVNEYQQLIGYPGKTQVPAPTMTDKSMVVFAFGQSNAANSGGERFKAKSDAVTNFWDGKFYRAQDPLLGATGINGTPWLRMADMLIEKGIADKVVIHSAGVGSSSIVDWQKGGRLYEMLETRLRAVPSGMPITHFLWHQGESDNPKLNPGGFGRYEAGMHEVIALTKKYFPRSHFYIALATKRREADTSPELHALQQRLAASPGVSLGPDTDLIDGDDRFDGTHLSGRGLERHAAAWVQAIEASH